MGQRDNGTTGQRAVRAPASQPCTAERPAPAALLELVPPEPAPPRPQAAPAPGLDTGVGLVAFVPTTAATAPPHHRTTGRPAVCRRWELACAADRLPTPLTPCQPPPDAGSLVSVSSSAATASDKAKGPLHRLFPPASLPACLPACQPACQPARLLAAPRLAQASLRPGTTLALPPAAWRRAPVIRHPSTHARGALESAAPCLAFLARPNSPRRVAYLWRRPKGPAGMR